MPAVHYLADDRFAGSVRGFAGEPSEGQLFYWLANPVAGTGNALHLVRARLYPPEAKDGPVRVQLEDYGPVTVDARGVLLVPETPNAQSPSYVPGTGGVLVERTVETDAMAVLAARALQGRAAAQAARESLKDAIAAWGPRPSAAAPMLAPAAAPMLATVAAPMLATVAGANPPRNQIGVFGVTGFYAGRDPYRILPCRTPEYNSCRIVCGLPADGISTAQPERYASVKSALDALRLNGSANLGFDGPSIGGRELFSSLEANDLVYTANVWCPIYTYLSVDRWLAIAWDGDTAYEWGVHVPFLANDIGSRSRLRGLLMQNPRVQIRP